MRLLRIVSSLIKKYYALLVCILTSVFTRIMNVDSWNRWGRKVSPLELVKEGEVAPVYTSD
jgi:galactitol-specific phosphotransferase system IIC component